LTSGTQDPQLVPAFVHAFTEVRSWQSWSATAPRMEPADTLLHEHTVAAPGSSS